MEITASRHHRELVTVTRNLTNSTNFLRAKARQTLHVIITTLTQDEKRTQEPYLNYTSEQSENI